MAAGAKKSYFFIVVNKCNKIMKFYNICLQSKGSERMECKLVFSPIIARRLLKMGNVLIDIKPKKENVNESIFVFENTEKFRRDFSFVKDK